MMIVLFWLLFTILVFVAALNPKQIASELDCPVEIVLGWIESQGVDA